ncbi:MAG: bile acid:sodium symporter family protein [Saprospiraceae bacterium]
MKNYAFTIFIFFAVLAAYFFPTVFTEIGGIKTTTLILPFLQVIMFGMGTTMTKDDFLGVLKNPKGVVIGLICQFAIMPFVGFTLTKIFSFPPEISAGIILIGSSPSGLASNVMAYIAKANVALSITITAFATLLAPVLTPFFMKVLGGGYVEIDFLKMMWDITKIVILPIVLGFAINTYLKVLASKLQLILPLISMFGIATVLVITTAAGHESLTTVGGMLLIAVLLHNLVGYTFGYFSSKLIFKLPEQDCRTVAIEVGLQNAGLASGLAFKMGKIATVGLAAALFGPLMNITGSILASYWSGKVPNEKIKQQLA